MKKEQMTQWEKRLGEARELWNSLCRAREELEKFRAAEACGFEKVSVTVRFFREGRHEKGAICYSVPEEFVGLLRILFFEERVKRLEKEYGQLQLED